MIPKSLDLYQVFDAHNEQQPFSFEVQRAQVNLSSQHTNYRNQGSQTSAFAAIIFEKVDQYWFTESAIVKIRKLVKKMLIRTFWSSSQGFSALIRWVRYLN